MERLRSTGESVHRVSEELGVSWAALTRWCRQLEAEGTVGSGNTEEELQAARKTIRRLEMEREIFKKSGGLLRQGKRMRYEFVKAEKAIYPVSVLCHVLRVSRSGFYAWVQRGESKRSRENRSLLKEIQAAHRVSRSNYGSPRITRELRAGGTRVGEKRVARIMRQNGIVGKVRRRYRVTTQAGDRAPAKPKLPCGKVR